MRGARCPPSPEDPKGPAAWAASGRVETAFLIPFAAGNFLYIASADLVPEIKHGASLRAHAVHFAAFLTGLGLLLVLRLALGRGMEENA